MRGKGEEKREGKCKPECRNRILIYHLLYLQQVQQALTPPYHAQVFVSWWIYFNLYTHWRLRLACNQAFHAASNYSLGAENSHGSKPSSADNLCLLIIFANSLDPDQARQNVRPDLDPNCLTLWWYSWKIFFQKVNLKNPKMTKKHTKLPACYELTFDT